MSLKVLFAYFKSEVTYPALLKALKIQLGTNRFFFVCTYLKAVTCDSP